MRRIALLAAVIAAPVAAQGPSLPHRLYTLPNGLRLLVHEDHSAPLVAVNLWVHVGSGHERPGRTGFAHLFEHLMFEGSRHVPEGDFDNLLEAAGAVNNGSTNPDRTNYYEVLPRNALELALWLEADRLGTLLDAVTPQKLALQREVVKNERRQSYENRPYGRFAEVAAALLYPPGHPYSWPTIGSMADLDAASLEDVRAFFRTYYVPNNVVLAVAGDVEADSVYRAVQRLFGWIPAGAPVPRPDVDAPPLPGTRYETLEDRVTLPQYNAIWRTTPAYTVDEAPLLVLAALLGEGRGSRLYQRLVVREQRAQSVSVFQDGMLRSGDFYVRVLARPEVPLRAIEAAVLEEIARVATAPPSEAEVRRARALVERALLDEVQTVLGKADRMNHYLYYTGRADYLAEDVARIRRVTPAAVQRVAAAYLHGRPRVVISIVPQGRRDLAAAAGGEGAR